jgi:formate hydrogenlyase subunit 6/NADH:ubiquinone oxidoreductase subunit I
MTVTLKNNPKFESGESKRKTIVDEFFIDDARCMRCNICAEVCPSNFSAITLQGSSWLTNELAALDRKNLVLDLQQLLAPSKQGVQINPLTPEQNQFAPEASRAWLWARGELSDAPQEDVAPSKHHGRLRTWAKAKALKILFRLQGR